MPLTPEATVLGNKGVENRENVGLSDRKIVINAILKHMLLMAPDRLQGLPSERWEV